MKIVTHEEEVALEIGESQAFTVPESGWEGMTYRQWLIGQCLASGTSAEQSISRADFVLRELAKAEVNARVERAARHFRQG